MCSAIIVLQCLSDDAKQIYTLPNIHCAKEKGTQQKQNTRLNQQCWYDPDSKNKCITSHLFHSAGSQLLVLTPFLSECLHKRNTKLQQLWVADGTGETQKKRWIEK